MNETIFSDTAIKSFRHDFNELGERLCGRYNFGYIGHYTCDIDSDNMVYDPQEDDIWKASDIQSIYDKLYTHLPITLTRFFQSYRK